MNDTLIKFDGKAVEASQVGSKNPVAAMIAQMMLSGQEYDGRSVQANDIQTQIAGAGIKMGGIQLG